MKPEERVYFTNLKHHQVEGSKRLRLLSSHFPLNLPSAFDEQNYRLSWFSQGHLDFSTSQIKMVDHLDCISRYLGSTFISLKTPTQISLPSLFLRKAKKAHWMLKSC